MDNNNSYKNIINIQINTNLSDVIYIIYFRMKMMKKIGIKN